MLKNCFYKIVPVKLMLKLKLVEVVEDILCSDS